MGTFGSDETIKSVLHTFYEFGERFLCMQAHQTDFD